LTQKLEKDLPTIGKKRLVQQIRTLAERPNVRSDEACILSRLPDEKRCAL
jgi:hypothetical protein